jgi:hypothetical protein
MTGNFRIIRPLYFLNHNSSNGSPNNNNPAYYFSYTKEENALAMVIFFLSFFLSFVFSFVFSFSELHAVLQIEFLALHILMYAPT